MDQEAEETELRRTLPVYINSFNQPTYLSQIVQQLLANGFANLVICDNASESSELLAYYDNIDTDGRVRVWRIGENIGPRATFQRILTRETGPFVFSDPDLILPEPLAPDFLTELFRLSRVHRSRKVGLALEIPRASERRDLVVSMGSLGEFTLAEWERRFWEVALEDGVYRADVDTTFFLWNAELRMDFRRMVRAALYRIRPYRLRKAIPEPRFIDVRVARPGFVARHRPWYIDDGMPPQEREFYASEGRRWSTWVK